MAVKIREKRKILFSKCDVIVAKVEDKGLNCIKIGINSTRTSPKVRKLLRTILE